MVQGGGAPYTGYFGTCVLGCTDPNATNYDPTADIDDGSCTFNNCSLINNDCGETDGTETLLTYTMRQEL